MWKMKREDRAHTHTHTTVVGVTTALQGTPLLSFTDMKNRDSKSLIQEHTVKLGQPRVPTVFVSQYRLLETTWSRRRAKAWDELDGFP